jgi:hypothetical protein
MMRYLIIAFAAALFLGCSASKTLIGEQQAIAIAVKVASTNSFHFTGTSEQPTHIKTVLGTLENATAKLQSEGNAVAYDSVTNRSDTKVWVVTMDGLWPRNFPPPLPNESPREPWHHLAVIVNAKTGDTISLAVP